MTANASATPYARVIAAEFARTGQLFRVDVAEMNFVAANPHFNTGADGAHVLVSPLAFCAVSRKVFACLHHAEMKDVAKWVLDGMPTMEGGEFIPYAAADRWLDGQRLQRAQASVAETLEDDL